MANQPSGSPFEFGARPAAHRPRGSLIKMFVILGVGMVLFVVIGSWLKRQLETDAASADVALPVKDQELWDAYEEDDKRADALYKNKWLQLTSDISDIHPVNPPPASAARAREVPGFALGKGKMNRITLTTDWLMECYIKEGKEKAFDVFRSGDVVTIRGKCLGKRDRQVLLDQCELVPDPKPK